MKYVYLVTLRIIYNTKAYRPDQISETNNSNEI